MDWHYYNYVLNKVMQNGHSLEYASRELKNNFDVVIEAIKNNKLLVYYIVKIIIRKTLQT